MAATCVSVAGFAVPAAYAVIGSAASGVPSSHVSSALVPIPTQVAGTPASVNALPKREFVPDLIAAVPGGITTAQLARISKLGGVTAILPVDGGKITVNGHTANLLGVSPQAFQPWTPLSTATSATVWAHLGQIGRAHV